MTKESRSSGNSPQGEHGNAISEILTASIACLKRLIEFLPMITETIVSDFKIHMINTSHHRTCNENRINF